MSSAEGAKIVAADREMAYVLKESAYQCIRVGEEYSCSPCPVGHRGRRYLNGFSSDLGSVCVRCPAGLLTYRGLIVT